LNINGDTILTSTMNTSNVKTTQLQFTITFEMSFLAKNGELREKLISN